MGEINSRESAHRLAKPKSSIVDNPEVGPTDGRPRAKFQAFSSITGAYSGSQRH